MSQQALKLALDLAIMHHTDEDYYELRSKVRIAAKEALAKQEQGKPVALDVTLDEATVEMLNAFSSPSPHLNDYSELRLMLGKGHSGYGLYLSLAEYPEEGSELLVNTTPPQRTWVGLTDEEMYLNCPNWLSQEHCKAWIQQIEAKLKEKNT